MPLKPALSKVDIDGVEFYSVYDYARHQDVTAKTIQEKLERGTLPYTTFQNSKYIPIEEGDSAWLAGSLGRSGKPPKKSAGNSEIISRAIESKAEKSISEAKLKDLEYQQKAGALVKVSEVNKALGEVAGAIRRSLENFADRTHIQLAAMGDADKVHVYLTREIDILMENFSNADTRERISKADIPKRAAPKDTTKRKRVGRPKKNSIKTGSRRTRKVANGSNSVSA